MEVLKALGEKADWGGGGGIWSPMLQKITQFYNNLVKNNTAPLPEAIRRLGNWTFKPF